MCLAFASALRRRASPGAAATNELVRRATTDDSRLVRAYAARALAGRTDSASQSSLDRILQTSPVEIVRREAIFALAERRDAFARAMLRRAASQDRSAELRELAKNALARR